MGEQETELRLEGIVRGSPGELVTAVECDDGNVWVIAYNEQSPFQTFADRHVVCFDIPRQPSQSTQHVIGWSDGRKLRHLLVSRMRLTNVTQDTRIIEVGAGYDLRGRLERLTSPEARSRLSFITEKGDAFLVANDPAGASVGQSVHVVAYPVQCSPSLPEHAARHLWVICPYSMSDLEAWRDRQR